MSAVTTSIQVDEECTYEELHKEVCKVVNVPESTDLKLVCKGKVLKSGTKISEYNIKNNDFIVYFTKKIKEKKQKPSDQPTTESSDQPSNEASRDQPVDHPDNKSARDQQPPTTQNVTTPVTPVTSVTPTITNNEQVSSSSQNVPSYIQTPLPPLESLLDAETLFGMRSTVLGIAINSLVANRQLLLSAVTTSPMYQRLLRSPDGMVTALLINHPDFLTPSVFRSMSQNFAGSDGTVENSTGHSGSSTGFSTGTPIGSNEPSETSVVPGPSEAFGIGTGGAPVSVGSAPAGDRKDNFADLSSAEKADIEEILQIFPTRGRTDVSRMYIECGKNKESTINLILQIT